MPKTKHKKTRFIGRIILIIIAVVVTVLLILTVLFNYYKDDIARAVLLDVNTVQPGELAFEDIAFNPFKYFPNISIELVDVDYFESKDKDGRVDSLPIIRLEKLYIAFDMIDLVMGNVNVSHIILQNGMLNLITYADSTFNITNAFGLNQDTTIITVDSTKQKVANFDLKGIALNGIQVSYNNIPGRTKSNYSVITADASLHIQDEQINSDLKTHFVINEINQTGGFLLSNKEVRIESVLIFDRIANKIKIEPSKFSFDKANFSIEGNLDLNNQGFIDVSIIGDDKDFSVLSLFLSETGVNNILGGKLFFNGSITGQLFDQIPMIDISFGMKDVEIQIPNTKEKIHKLNLSGIFKSGEKKDFSEALLEVNGLTGKLPGGNMKGYFSIVNFTRPVLNAEYEMVAEIFGFDKIFNLGLIDSLSGKLAINAKYAGAYDQSIKTIDVKTDSAVINFENLSFTIPNVNKVKNMTGLIKLKNGSAFFNNLELEIGTSDFKINGSLTNLFSLFSEVDTTIKGDLQILANTYDFTDFFNYNPKVAGSFPYQIKDINLNVNVLSSTKDLSDFVVSPKIVFNIQSLEAEINEFLPPININNGVFTLGDIDSSLNLDFSDFEIEIAGSRLLTDVVFNSPKIDPNWLTVDLEAKNINPQKTFIYWTEDSISNYLNGKIGGLMHLDLIFSDDSIIFDKLDFTSQRFEFINAIDTINLKDLRLYAKNIDYDTSDSIDLMETLSFESELQIKDAFTNHFNADDLDYKINANRGVYRISLNKSQFFNKNGEGILIISPYEKTPRFELKYKVSQFGVDELFSTFKKDTVLSGKMDMELEIGFSGIDSKEFSNSINGRILLKGKNLKLYGLDLDKVIDRFKRSQKFTLADVSAVVLMGPAGLLVTKGSDFASLVVLYPGEFSEIVELSSDWEFDNGIMNLTDVAFTTYKNRMAATGSVNLISDSLSVELALLNELGCSVYSQEIFGALDSIELSKVKVVKSLLAPVTNLVDNQSKCDVFYTGKVKQPNKRK